MPDQLLYGAAYYLEYLPEDRLETDMTLLQEAGFNLIRIAESTWSTWEPEDGVFDFSKLKRVLEAALAHGLSVIVGTPTYAIPPWLARKYPDVLSDTHSGPCRYGPRQNFDLTHPGYRYHAERIIRRLMEAVQGYDCVIGFQLDNETKPYDTCSPRAQALFKDWLQERFPSLEALNEGMGFAYWSNSLGSWEDLPDVRGTINGSFGGEYQAFQRHLVTEFLQWQRDIVDEYRRPDQFVTHNFDYEWRNYSFGLQPDVDQFEAAQALTIAGCDIYHKGEDDLTGAEIAFGGAIARGLKRDNYLVLETQAQGNFGWLPYPGQLRLQAYSHLAGGADCVEYWHWHSIHNAVESYWKGVLSHDLTPGETYREASTIGRELKQLSPHLLHLKKNNRVAVMASNRSLTGFQWFPTCQQGETPDKNYNDYLRWICDSLYRLNVEYDIISDQTRDFSQYDLLVLPCLYSAPEELLRAVARYVQEGGQLIATFRTGYADEYLKIYHDTQPHILTECLGVRYDRYTKPRNVTLAGDTLPLPEGIQVTDWMELLEPTGAEVLCRYGHPVWGGIPAVTRNRCGKGQAVYLGACFDGAGLDALLRTLLPQLNITPPGLTFPVILRSGRNQLGKQITYYFNYSNDRQMVSHPHPAAASLLDGEALAEGEEFSLDPWDLRILEYDSPQC